MKNNAVQTLTRLKSRVEMIFALGANRLAASALGGFMDDVLKNLPNDLAIAKQYLEAAKSKEKLVELCAARILTYGNIIAATTKYADIFFEKVTLGENEHPEIENTDFTVPIQVSYLSQDSRPRMIKATLPVAQRTPIPLRLLATDEVGYFIRDIYEGRVDVVVQRGFDLAQDMADKRDELAFTMLTAPVSSGGAIGAFRTTGTASLRTFAQRNGGRIREAYLPTTNNILLSGNTAAGNVFRLAVLDAAASYANRLTGIFRDGDPVLTGLVHVPSIDLDALPAMLPVTATASNNPIVVAIMQNNRKFHYLGVDWVLTPDPTLESGACYFTFNRPVGVLFDKPSWNEEHVDTQPKKNWESRYLTNFWAGVIPEPRRVNILRVIYNDAYVGP